MTEVVRLGRLELLREAAGLSKTALANLVGLTISMVSQLESGTKTTSLASTVRIAKVLGCKVDDLLEEPSGVPEALQDFLRMTPHTPSPQEIAALRAIRIPGYRLTAIAYGDIYNAMRNSERMHS